MITLVEFSMNYKLCEICNNIHIKIRTKYTIHSNSPLFSVQFALHSNVASAREWDFTAQQFGCSWVFAHSEVTLLTIQCKWTFTKRLIFSTLQENVPCFGKNHKKTLRWQQ